MRFLHYCFIEKKMTNFVFNNGKSKIVCTSCPYTKDASMINVITAGEENISEIPSENDNYEELVKWVKLREGDMQL